MYKKLAILIGCLILLSSCVSDEAFQRTQNNLYYLQRANNSANQRIANLERKITVIEKKLDKFNKEATSLKATQVLNYNELSSDVQALKNEIQDFKTLSKRSVSANGDTTEVTQEAIKDIYSRLTDIDNELRLLKTSGQATGARNSDRGNYTVKNDTYYYKDAYSSFTAGKYSEAEKKFKAFLENFKDSKLRPNAFYWLGECYFKMKMYDKAIINYDEVIVKYHKNPKVPAALLKEGIAFLRIGEKDGAKLIFRKIVHDYPKTRQAKYARDYLKKLR